MLPGNMFVPIDLLRPILGELRAKGASAASRRAWLGITGADQNGQVRVMRVSEDSPAEAAGVRAGDRILAIDGAAVDSLDALWTRLWNGAAERDVTLDIERDDARQTLNVRTVDRNRQLKRATGV
jgi:serine protease Do